jgi:hypothetical protein
MNKSMIANRPLTYGTRRLKAGDGFTAASRDADILNRLGRARYAEAGARDKEEPKEEAVPKAPKKASRKTKTARMKA